MSPLARTFAAQESEAIARARRFAANALVAPFVAPLARRSLLITDSPGIFQLLCRHFGEWCSVDCFQTFRKSCRKLSTTAILAGSTGVEPAIFSVTGTDGRPRHHEPVI